MLIVFENEGFTYFHTYLSFLIWEYFSGKEPSGRVFVLDLFRVSAGGWRQEA
jgi:hypothetical protein